MKKLFLFILLATGSLLISCGGSNENSGGCKSNADCPIGQVCSESGSCVANNSEEAGENGNGGSTELPDTENGPDTGNTGTQEQTGDSGDTQSGENGDTADSGSSSGDSQSEEETDTTDSGDTQSGENGDTSDSGSEPVNDNEYDDLEITPDDDVEFCPTTCADLITDDGCLRNADGSAKNVDENAEGLCNGLDDDCDGDVDEGCPCEAGQTQACFNGKPAQRNVGTCRDGIQTCKINPMRAVVKGTWGKCKNAILPTKDLCDKADNNCNGCSDEGLCCSPKIDCSYDIGTAFPFADKLIDGTKIYDPGNEYQDADKATWEWTLTKGSCDIVLKKTSFSLASAVEGVTGASTDEAEKITFSGVGLSKFNVNFQLSGTYNLHLKVTRENGEVYECEWPLKVASNGLRIELCWDTYSSIDVDLHLGKENKTTAWNNNSECYWKNCDTSRGYNGTDPDWGYLNTMNYDPATGAEKSMPNPRLDIDNRAEGEGAKPENINLDNPVENDVFKVLVHHYSPAEVVNGECLDWYHGVFVDICLEYEEIYTYSYPVVNVYCGGSLKATYGTGETGTQVSDFRDRDDSWEVVKIKWVGDPTSDECILTPNLKENNAQVPTFTDW